MPRNLILAILPILFGCTTLGAPILVDIPYVDEPHAEQYFDLHWAPDRQAPIVLFVHGGGLDEAGERRGSEVYRDVCPRLVARGIACATTDYRLSPTFRWPTMPEDVASAFVTLRQLVSERGGPTDRIFLFGHSSGCHLSAVVGMNPRYLGAHDLSTDDVAGIIAMGCTLDRHDTAARRLDPTTIQASIERDPEYLELYQTAENWFDANPASHVGPHVPPLLVLLARKERFFPSILEQGARLVRSLKELERPAELEIVPGSHMNSIEHFGESGDPSIDLVESFIRDPSGFCNRP